MSIKNLIVIEKSLVNSAKHRFIMSGLKLLSGLKMAWMSLSLLLPYTDVPYQVTNRPTWPLIDMLQSIRPSVGHKVVLKACFRVLYISKH